MKSAWFKKNFFLCIGIMNAMLFLPAANAQQNTAKAYSPQIPVLKGLPENPVLRVAVSGDAETMIKKANCTLNASAIASVQKIDVYLTGAEPFSSRQLIGSFSPVASRFSMEIPAKISGGVGFLWFSVVLKDNAGLDNWIELHCNELIDQKGRSIAVKEYGGHFIKPCGVVVRRAGDDKVNTYRIPGIVQTDRGTLIAVYDIRYNNSGDLPGNIDVGMSRSADSGKTWQPMKVIMDMGAPHENNGVGDPAVLFDPATKKIFVAALGSKGNRSIAGSLPGLSPDTTGQFILVSSEDDGLTWSAPYSITSQVKEPAWHLFFDGPGNGIAMSDGKLVFAAQYWDQNKKPFSTIIYSDDHGKTWKGKLAGPKSNTTESQVVEIKKGILMLNMRDNRGGFRSIATTTDMGQTWMEHNSSFNALADPVCMGSLINSMAIVKGQKKQTLFFSNPNTSSGRYNITIRASLDNGESWSAENQFLLDERTCYGYSCLTRLDDKNIGILYEGVKDLYFVKIPVNKIIK